MSFTNLINRRLGFESKCRDKADQKTTVNTEISTEAKLTRTEAARVLFKFIYPEESYFTLTTYYPKNAEENLGVYRYIVPSNPVQRVINIEYIGIHGQYHIFELYLECYSFDGSGSRTYTHSNYTSAYAVNITSREVITQRWNDENGVPIYNEKYNQMREKIKNCMNI